MGYESDPRGCIGYTVIMVSLFMAPFVLMDYHTTNYRAHVQRMEKDPVYAEYVNEQAKKESMELRELGQQLVRGWTDKHRIPGLQY